MFYVPSTEGFFFLIAIKKLKLTLYFVLLFWYRPVDRDTVLSIFFTGAE